MRARRGWQGRGRSLAAIATTLALAAGAGSSASAKTVALIDNSYNDNFLNCGEGWVRATGVDDANIQIGGSFTTGLGRLASGDALIIVAHGTAPGSFVWAKTAYTDFGAAAGQMPLPDGFANLKNVKVQFVTCFSATAPTGGGSSILDKLLAAMGGAGNSDTGTGYVGTVTTTAVTSMSGGTDPQYTAAQECLDAYGGPWINNPPANRPNTGGKGQPANQRSAGQALIDNCTGVPANKLTFNLPNQVGARAKTVGYAPPVDSGRTGAAPAAKWGAAEDVAVCGDGEDSPAPNDEPVPAGASTWGRLKSVYR